MGDMIPDGYRILVHFDATTEKFVAAVPELGEIKTEGKTRAEAMEKAEQAIESAIRNAAEQNTPLPTPLDRTEFSGEITVKISPSLHRELAFLATEDGMEADQLASELINTGIAIRTTGRLKTSSGHGASRDERASGGRRRSGRPPKKNYHNIMDDRAAFIEYVRSIDAGGKRGGGRSRPRRKK